MNISFKKLNTPPKKLTQLRKLKANDGFVLIFSVIIASILLSVGLAMFSIALKELILSASGRNSQFAFYAADSAIECAIYWDIRYSGFSESVFATSSDSSILPQGSNVLCNGEDITLASTGWDSSTGWDISGVSSSGATTVFDMAFANGSCATVSVIKESGNTRVDSRGYNTCDLNNTRRVERGLRVRY